MVLFWSRNQKTSTRALKHVELMCSQWERTHTAEVEAERKPTTSAPSAVHPSREVRRPRTAPLHCVRAGRAETSKGWRPNPLTDRGAAVPGRAPGYRRGRARAQPDRGGIRRDHRDAGPDADAHRAGHLLGALVGALLLQAHQAGAPTFPTEGPQVVQGPGRTPACCGCPTDGRWPSRSNPTITPARSSPIRARPPAWAASCATCSPWARARWRCSIRCAWGRSTIRATATSLPAS